MIVDCISDLHGHYPQLEGGDLLIVAGDLTKQGSAYEYGSFGAWLDRQKYKKKVLIAGNHDTFFSSEGFTKIEDVYRDIDVEYLCDSGTEFKGLKIWGSPWSLWFEGINPHCTAFTGTEEQLAEQYAKISDDIDILVTHGPPHNLLDELVEEGWHAGSVALENVIRKQRNIKIACFGHIHESYGIGEYKTEKPGGWNSCIVINASHVNEHYEPVNRPIRVIL